MRYGQRLTQMNTFPILQSFSAKPLSPFIFLLPPPSPPPATLGAPRTGVLAVNSVPQNSLVKKGNIT